MSVKHNEQCIEAKDVGFSYGGQPVLENISFSVADGDYVGVIGPNGGGKTTLLKLILGLLTPANGAIKIFGHSVKEAKQHFEIGYVPQNISQDYMVFPATVEEVIRSGRTVRRGVGTRFTPADEAVVNRTIEITNVGSFRHDLIGNLSGGQRQRAFIARALAAEPKILILDEPTVGVDISSKEQFDELLKELNEKQGLTIMIVSHDVDAVAEQVKHVVCINKVLVCHLHSSKFSKGKYLRDVYGSKVRGVEHDHHALG